MRQVIKAEVIANLQDRHVLTVTQHLLGLYSYMLFNPAISAETIAWIVGLGIIIDGIGNWIKVALVNKVEKRFVKLHDRLKEVEDIAWEDVK